MFCVPSLRMLTSALLLSFRARAGCSRATMELQIKTAMQMRDQGHALKQKALDLVAEAEQKVLNRLSNAVTNNDVIE